MIPPLSTIETAISDLVSHDTIHSGMPARDAARHLYSARAAGWSLLCPIASQRRAIVASGNWTPAPFVLANIYESVEVVTPDSMVDKLRAVYRESPLDIRVVAHSALYSSVPLDSYQLIAIINPTAASLSDPSGILSPQRLLGLAAEKSSGSLITGQHLFGWRTLKKLVLGSSSPAPGMLSSRRAQKIFAGAGMAVCERFGLERNSVEPRFVIPGGGGFRRRLDLPSGVAVTGSRDSCPSFIRSLTSKLAAEMGPDARAKVESFELRRTGNGLVALDFGQNRRGFLRIPLNQAGAQQLDQANDTESIIRRERPDLAPLLPRKLSRGYHYNLLYELEDRMPGQAAAQYRGDRRVMLTNVVDILLELGGYPSVSHRKIDQSFASRYLLAPFDTLANRWPAGRQPIEAIAQRVSRLATGKLIPLLWVHGDFNSRNVLVDAASGKVTGIIDWDAAHEDGLPLLDLAHFLMSLHRYSFRFWIGELTPRLMTGELLNPDEQACMTAYASALDLDEGLMRALIVVF